MTDPTSAPDSTPPPDATRILSAILETDGSISLQIIFPDSTTPVAASIDPIETTIHVAGPVRRSVELRYGHPHDRLLRLVVAMHVDALAYERCHQPRPLCVPNAELPLVTWMCPTSALTSSRTRPKLSVASARPRSPCRKLGLTASEGSSARLGRGA